MKTVVVLQGLPGSGKSYYAQSLKKGLPDAEVVICSADDYFLGGGGVYKFDPSKLSEAHGACFRRFIESLRRGDSLVVVDNTNTTTTEISPYMLGASAYGYEGEVVVIRCDPQVAAARNIHGVPLHAVRAMADRIVSCQMPPWWKVTQIEAG